MYPLRHALILGSFSTFCGMLILQSGWLAGLELHFSAAHPMVVPPGESANLLSVLAAVFTAYLISFLLLDPVSLESRLFAAGIVLGQLSGLAWMTSLLEIPFSPVPSFLTFGISLAAGAWRALGPIGKRETWIYRHFHGRLSEDLLCEFAKNQGGPQMTPETACLTISLPLERTEILDTTKCRDFYPHFSNRVREILLEHGAFLNPSAPDRLVGVFGFPVGQTDAALRACRAALAVIREHSDPADSCRIGISYGQCFATAGGSKHAPGFAVHGDVLSFSGHLADSAASYGIRILLDSQVFQRTLDVPVVRPVELIPIEEAEGRRWIELHELLGMPENLSKLDIQRRDTFWRAVILYRRNQFQEASELWTKLAMEAPDPLIEWYQFRMKQLKEP